MEVQRLELIAKKVRTDFELRNIDYDLMERILFSEHPILKDYISSIRQGWIEFPQDSCTMATLYLKQILGEGEVFHGKFLGHFGKIRHDFLLIDKRTVVDITADQFMINEQTRGPPIYIGPLKTPWLREPWMY